MKIIKEGKIPEPINPYKIICKNCHTEFEYENNDIKEKTNKYIEHNISLAVYDDYIRAKVRYVECPLCKENYEIDREIISIDTLSFSQMFQGKTKDFEELIGWND